MCDESWKISCHEAGHAIVAVHYGIPFVRVSRGEGEEGEVEPAVNPIDDSESVWTDEKLIQFQEFYAAGAAAERVMFDEERQYAFKGDKCNHKKLELRLRKREQGFEEDIQAAMKLLIASAIEKVANELEERRKSQGRGDLTIEEVARIIGVRLPWQ